MRKPTIIIVCVLVLMLASSSLLVYALTNNMPNNNDGVNQNPSNTPEIEERILTEDEIYAIHNSLLPNNDPIP